jgi:hypothetical protein
MYELVVVSRLQRPTQGTATAPPRQRDGTPGGTIEGAQRWQAVPLPTNDHRSEQYEQGV